MLPQGSLDIFGKSGICTADKPSQQPALKVRTSDERDSRF